MFYEEKYINGILFCRYLPDAEFKIVSRAMLCDRLRNAEIELKNLKMEIKINKGEKK